MFVPAPPPSPMPEGLEAVISMIQDILPGTIVHVVDMRGTDTDTLNNASTPIQMKSAEEKAIDAGMDAVFDASARAISQEEISAIVEGLFGPSKADTDADVEAAITAPFDPIVAIQDDVRANIREERTYYTSDGNPFDTYGAAEAHEAGLSFSRAFAGIDVKIGNVCAPFSVFAIANKDMLIALLEQIG